MLQVLGNQPAATMWTDGRQTLVLAIGVLVPGQTCLPGALTLTRPGYS